MATVKKKQPTQRSLEYLRKCAATAAVEVVERWNSHAKIRQDLFGFIDVLAIPDHQKGLWAFQVTTSSNLAARRQKALQEPKLRLWLTAGNRFFLHGWSKRASGRWEVREEEITLEQLDS